MSEILGDAGAFLHELMRWANARQRGCRTGGAFPDAVGSIQLHHRPDPQAPEVQLTFAPAIVDGRPVIQVRLPETARPFAAPSSGYAGRQFAVMSGSGLPLPEPEQVCEACGTLGTVGRVVYNDGRGAVRQLYRFCAECWPEEAARHRARWEETQRRAQDATFASDSTSDHAPLGGIAFEGASWHAALELVREIERTMHPQPPPSREDLAAFAAELREQTSHLEGPVPFEVRAFVQRYSPSAGGPVCAACGFASSTCSTCSRPASPPQR